MRSSEAVFVGGLFSAALLGTAWRAWALPAEAACRADAEVLEDVRCAPAGITTALLKWGTIVAGATTAAALLASLVDD